MIRVNRREYPFDKLTNLEKEEEELDEVTKEENENMQIMRLDKFVLEYTNHQPSNK